MPRVDINPTAISDAGIFPAGTVGNVDGNSITNTGREFLELVNANTTTARVVTIPTPSQLGGLDVADRAVNVPAAARVVVGPFNPVIFNQANSKLFINYVSGVEAGEITVRAYRFPS